ncbi:MAG: STAS domain-containing protein [bacterium]|nr:STAS domain-containing protein [bacterium]
MIRVSSSGDIFTLHLRGDVDHMEMVDVRNSISDLIGEGHAKLIVSMKEVEHINYLSIGVLLERLKRLRSFGGDLKLVGLSQYLKNILTSVGATDFFDCFDSEEEALTSFSIDYDWEVSA